MLLERGLSVSGAVAHRDQPPPGPWAGALQLKAVDRVSEGYLSHSPLEGIAGFILICLHRTHTFRCYIQHSPTPSLPIHLAYEVAGDYSSIAVCYNVNLFGSTFVNYVVPYIIGMFLR